jgi:predicted  nucleic acid-binding Zn-ribbon protein
MQEQKPEKQKIQIKQVENDIKQFENHIKNCQFNIQKLNSEISKFDAKKSDIEKQLNNIPPDADEKQIKTLHHELKICSDGILARQNKIEKVNENLKTLETNRQRYLKFLSDYEAYRNKEKNKKEEQEAKINTPVKENVVVENKILNISAKENVVVESKILENENKLDTKEDNFHSNLIDIKIEIPQGKISIVDCYIERAIAQFNQAQNN